MSGYDKGCQGNNPATRRTFTQREADTPLLGSHE